MTARLPISRSTQLTDGLTDTLGDTVPGVVEALEAVRGRHDVSVKLKVVHGIVDPRQFVGQLVGAVVLTTLHQVSDLRLDGIRRGNQARIGMACSLIHPLSLVCFNLRNN